MGVPRDIAIKTACPLCGAKPGKPCMTIAYTVRRPRSSLHQERVQAAGRDRWNERMATDEELRKARKRK